MLRKPVSAPPAPDCMQCNWLGKSRRSGIPPPPHTSPFNIRYMLAEHIDGANNISLTGQQRHNYDLYFKLIWSNLRNLSFLIEEIQKQIHRKRKS